MDGLTQYIFSERTILFRRWERNHTRPFSLFVVVVFPMKSQFWSIYPPEESGVLSSGNTSSDRCVRQSRARKWEGSELSLSTFSPVFRARMKMSKKKRRNQCIFCSDKFYRHSRRWGFHDLSPQQTRWHLSFAKLAPALPIVSGCPKCRWRSFGWNLKRAIFCFRLCFLATTGIAIRRVWFARRLFCCDGCDWMVCLCEGNRF